MRSVFLLAALALLCAACRQPSEQMLGGNAAGVVIGAEFDGTPLTIGKGKLANKPLVITWFATW